MTTPDSNVDRLYLALRRRAAEFGFKPGARINESALAEEFDASRTPIREALNRLVAEGFVTFQGGRGFFCRPLRPEAILELNEARIAVECEAVRLSCQRAGDAQLAELAAALDGIAQDGNAEAEDLLAMDEAFHRRLAGLSGNAEILRLLDNLADRIRYVRRIDLDLRRPRGDLLATHRGILDVVTERKPEKAARVLRGHLERSRDEVTEAVRAAFAQLYMPEA